MSGVTGALEDGSLVGRRLGDFELVERIGAGGFGVIYRAAQPDLGRDVVVKVRQGSGEPGNDREVARFLREAQLASQLDHPFAAHVYAFGAEPEGLLWIAMELVRGTSLADVLTLRGALELSLLVPLVDDIADVVATGHERAVVHGDIKPSNIMVVARGGRLLPKLLDFGLAREIDAAERSASGAPIVGSPPYMAPELWTDPASAGPPADLYALGATIYELVTGRQLFEGDGVIAIARAHARGKLRAVGAALPAELDAFFATALARSSADRFSSARQLAREFRAAAGFAAASKPLPRLDRALFERWVSAAPAPIASALAGFDSARNAHQALAAERTVGVAIVRWLANIALACRARLPVAVTETVAVEKLRQLARGSMREREWVDLAAALCASFSSRPEAFPVPELARLFARDDARALLVAAKAVAATEAEARALLAQRLEALTVRLGELAFILDYPIALATNDGAVSFCGARPDRPLVTMVGPSIPLGELVLANADHFVVLSLSPLVQVAEPTPGATPALFLFDGSSRRGARLVALPSGHEIGDPSLFEWLGASLRIADAGHHVAADDERAPFRGLAPFRRADADLFFGRDRETEILRNRLRDQPLVALVGPSGSGKSSVIEAGVVAELPASWTAITLRPGAAPLSALASALASNGISGEGLAARPSQLGQLLAAAARERGGSIFLVVDQFEELFTLGASAEDGAAFATAIASAAQSPSDPVRVAITLRDDFLMRAESLPPLRRCLARGLQLIGTPPPVELARVIAEPLAAVGYTVDEPDLIDAMVAEVAGEPSGLALLSFAAAKLWELRDRKFKRVLRSAYDAMGGVGGALAKHADEVFDAMSAEEKRGCRDAFRELVTAEGTRAVLRRSELRELIADPDVAESVIEKLIAARLLASAEADDGSERIEIVHEALLTAWPTLATWRATDTRWAELRDQLRQAARHWDDRGRSSGLVWRDDALADYQRWRAQYPGQVTSTEEAFAKASVAEAGRGRRRRQVAIGAIVGALVVGLVAALWSNRQTEHARARAEAQRVLADQKTEQSEARLTALREEEGRQLLLAGDSIGAIARLGEAWRRGARSAALDFMIERASLPLRQEIATLLGHKGQIFALAVSPDGRHIATGGEDRAVRLWDARTGESSAALEGHEAAIFRLAFSPDSSLVASASFDGTARVWDVASQRQTAKLQHTATVWTARFSHDSAWIATASDDGTAAAWNSRTGERRARMIGHGGPVRSAVFSPSSDRLVTSSHDGTARLWDAASGLMLSELVGHEGAVVWAEFDPSGHSVVTASYDGTARLWSASGTKLAVLGPHQAAVLKAQFSPSGDRIVTGTRLGEVRLWDGGGRLIAPLEGHDTLVIHVAFSPDGRRFATSSEDGRAHLFSTESGQKLLTLVSSASIRRVEFTRDGERLVTIATNGEVQMWHAEDVGEKASFALPGEPIRVDAGSQLVLARLENGVAATDLKGVTRRSPGGAGELVALGVSADGRTVIASALDGDIRLAEIESGELLGLMRAPEKPSLIALTDSARAVFGGAPSGAVFYRSLGGEADWQAQVDGSVIAISAPPSGPVLAVASSAEKVTIWTRRGEKIAEVPGTEVVVLPHEGRVIVASGAETVIYSIAGGRLASFEGTVVGSPLTSGDLAIRAETGFELRSVEDGGLRVTLDNRPRWVPSADFSADGELLASPDLEKREVSVWDARRGHKLFVLPTRATPREVRFVDNPSRLVVVGADNSATVLTIGGVSEADLGRLLGCASGELERGVQCGALARLGADEAR